MLHWNYSALESIQALLDLLLATQKEQIWAHVGLVDQETKKSPSSLKTPLLYQYMTESGYARPQKDQVEETFESTPSSVVQEEDASLEDIKCTSSKNDKANIEVKQQQHQQQQNPVKSIIGRSITAADTCATTSLNADLRFMVIK